MNRMHFKKQGREHARLTKNDYAVLPGSLGLIALQPYHLGAGNSRDLLQLLHDIV
jgi:hypothetical protein